MRSKHHPYIRSAQVLRLLAAHGPMSLFGIHACIYPELDRRRLYEVMQRLIKTQLIKRVTFPARVNATYFYQVNTDGGALRKLSEIIGVATDQIRSNLPKRDELLHSDSCAMWAEYFKFHFPQALVLREHHYFGKAEYAKILLSTREDRETNPDLLLLFPAISRDRPIAIGVEIERNPKKLARLLHKLKTYSTETRLDGLIYFCEGRSTNERIRHLYSSRVATRALRVSHYGDNFAIFCDSEFQGIKANPTMQNVRSQKILLNNWMQLLTSTPEERRRNEAFARSALTA